MRNDADGGRFGNAPWNEYRPCPGCPKCADTDGYVLRRGSWRHTRAHETVLMCVKQMQYWSNQEAVREALACADRIDDYGYFRGNRRHETEVDEARMGIRDNRDAMNKAPAGRNPRSVLTPKPESYKGNHYAAFPTSLIAPLIRAACPARCCPACGMGWAPVVEPSPEYAKLLGRDWADYGQDEEDGRGHFELLDGTRSGTRPTKRNAPGVTASYNVLGYRPTCECNCEDWQPGIVFDPFLGSGTTLQVAKDLMLRGIGLDLAHQYLDEQAKVRAKVSAPSAALDGLPMWDLTTSAE